LTLQTNSSPSWIFDHPTFLNWVGGTDNSSNSIWLSATAGFGKSVLSAYLTVELQTRFPNNPVTFFLCREKSELSQSSQIVRTILRQLVQFSPSTFEYIQKIWEEDEDIADLTASYRKFYENLLVPALKFYHQTSSKLIFILLDGLNELPTARLDEVLALVNTLTELHSAPEGSPVRIIITSQPTPRITAGLNPSVINVPLTGKDNVDNVETYVKGALSESITKLFGSTGRDPVTYFRENHFGMFLWVKAILELLQSLDVTSDLQRILDNPPRTINGVYQRVLERLGDELNEVELPWIREIISWTVMSKRDMSLAELEVAILLSNGDNGHALDAKVIDIKSTLKKCAAILQISQGSTCDIQTVSLLHNTFRQFITNPGAQGPQGKAREFLVRKSETDSTIAAACLGYLMRHEIVIEEGKFLPNARRKLLNTRFPLFNYATLYWSNHLTNKASVGAQEKVVVQLQSFFLREHLLRWVSSVMAYTYNSAQGSLFDPVSWSVTSSLRTSLAWICRNPVTSLRIIVRISQQSPAIWARVREFVDNSKSMELLLKCWCASVAAELWVTVAPRYWEISIRCFDIAKALYNCSADKQNQTFETTVRATADLAQLSTSPNEFKWFVNHSSVYLYNVWQHEILVLATTALHSALELAPNVSDKATVLSRFSTVFRSYYQSTNAIEDLNKAIHYDLECLAIAPIEDQDYEAYLEIAAGDLFARAERNANIAGAVATSSQEDCQKAAKMTVEALQMTLSRHFHLDLASEESTLPPVDVITFNVLKSIKDRTAEGEGMDLPPGVFQILSTLSYGLSVQQTTTIQVDGDIRDFVSICKNALSCMVEHNPTLWTTLGSAYYSFYRAAKASKSSGSSKAEETSGNTGSAPESLVSDLDECIECYRKALSLTPSGHVGIPSMTNNLGRALEMYEGTGPHLDEAIDCFRKAIELTPHDRIDLVIYFFNLAANLRRRKASDVDTNEAITHYRRVLSLAPERHVLLPYTWTHLGHIFYGREEETDHREAVHCYRMALKYLPKGTTAYAIYASNLANALKKVAACPTDYTEVIEYNQIAVDNTEESKPSFETYHKQLANALMERLSADDTTRAIASYKKCIEISTSEPSTVATYKMNLGKALWNRGEPEDLVEAEEWLQQALENIDTDDLRHCLNLLGLTLSKRNGPGDLDRAVEFHRRAVQAAQDNKFISVFESNLGKAFVKRNGDGDTAEAIRWFKLALDHAVENPSTRAQYCNSIGEAYAVDAAKTDDIEQSVVWFRKAIELETDNHEKVAGYLTALGDSLQNLQEGHGDEAVEVTQIAIAMTSKDSLSYPYRLMCLATALKNRGWFCKDTHETKLWRLSYWLTNAQRNFITASLNIFSKGRSYDNVDESLSLLQQAIELYEKASEEVSIIACESALVDCLMIDYTYKKSSENLSRATEIFRKFLSHSTRDNKECRGWDGIRFGTLCIKRFCDQGRVSIEDLDLLIGKSQAYIAEDEQLRWIVEIAQKLRERTSTNDGWIY